MTEGRTDCRVGALGEPSAELAFAFTLDRGGFRLDVDLRMPARGITALFGRSGCGKTSILRCVAGLERAAGHCRLNGELWQDDARALFVPTHKRQIGYVFQEPSLFPHLSVRRNLEYGFKRISAAEQQVGFDEVVHLLGIRQLLARAPAGLSGGERQRVAMARALLTSPKLLLMDEPLSALDHRSKQDILPYLERLHDALRIPVLYVSHSPDEVARLADQLVLLDSGRALANGPVAELMSRLDLPLASDDEAASVIDAVVSGHDDVYHLSEVRIAGGRLAVARLERPIGAGVRVRIHARDVSLALERPGVTSILNVLPARVMEMNDMGAAQVLVRLCIGDGGETPLLARITRRSRDVLELTPGDRLFAQVKSVALMD